MWYYVRFLLQSAIAKAKAKASASGSSSSSSSSDSVAVSLSLSESSFYGKSTGFASAIDASRSPLGHLFSSDSGYSSMSDDDEDDDCDDEDLPWCTDIPDIPCICHCACQYGVKTWWFIK